VVEDDSARSPYFSGGDRPMAARRAAGLMSFMRKPLVDARAGGSSGGSSRGETAGDEPLETAGDEPLGDCPGGEAPLGEKPGEASGTDSRGVVRRFLLGMNESSPSTGDCPRGGAGPLADGGDAASVCLKEKDWSSSAGPLAVRGAGPLAERGELPMGGVPAGDSPLGDCERGDRPLGDRPATASRARATMPKASSPIGGVLARVSIVGWRGDMRGVPWSKEVGNPDGSKSDEGSKRSVGSASERGVPWLNEEGSPEGSNSDDGSASE